MIIFFYPANWYFLLNIYIYLRSSRYHIHYMGQEEVQKYSLYWSQISSVIKLHICCISHVYDWTLGVYLMLVRTELLIDYHISEFYVV